MSELFHDLDEADVDRVRALVNIGAGHAANALAVLTGTVCEMRPPRVRLLSPARFAEPVVDVLGEAREDQVGVFFDLEGGFGGVLALLFPEASCSRILELLTGSPRKELPAAVCTSALREVGNILASHVATALGAVLGVTVLPSIPVLATEEAPEALSSLLATRAIAGPALRVETEIFDRERSIHGLLVFVPDSVRRIAHAPGF